jgi:cysteine desulfuration protein SufE
VLHLLYNGKTPEQALVIPIEETFETIGLAGHLTPSRRNGFFSMVERIRSVAAAEAP